MTVWRFEFPELPVSVNKLYTVSHGRKVMTREGRRFKNAFKSSRGGMDPLEFMQVDVDPFQEYVLEAWFYLPPEELYALTFGKDKRIKSPFKDVDVSNMIKLVEDCVAALLALRDRNNFDVLLHKREADHRGARIVVYVSSSHLPEDPHEAVGPGKAGAQPQRAGR